MSASNSTPLRAAGYCRTSGEGQRDNTSIPRQKEAIAAFCKGNGWRPPEFYVDECKSGAKFAGRDAFKRMVSDATAGRLDVLVPYDAKRFGRDGVDIMSTAKMLRATFGVFVVDTRGQFDNRDHRNVLRNFVEAGVSESERLTIMERTLGGRIQRARDGLLWCNNPPVGRQFTPAGKQSGRWSLSELGVTLGALLARYASGESLNNLCREYGLPKGSVIRNVHNGQLAGRPYVAVFHSPEIGIVNLRVEVPAVPQVITPELERRVLDRLTHNRTWNKQCLRKYLLSGFVRCAICEASLTAEQRRGVTYYRHHRTAARRGCGFRSIPGGAMEAPVLDYLYNWFVDQPAFDLAVRLALPPAGARQERQAEVDAAQKDLAKAEQAIARLVDAVAAGADPELLTAKQQELKATRDALRKRLDGLRGELAALPDPSAVRAEAETVRAALARDHTGKDWRGESYEDIRRFLHFLFSDNPGRNALGVFVRPAAGGSWTAEVRARLFLRSPERLDLGDGVARFVGEEVGEVEDITAFRRVNLSRLTCGAAAPHTERRGQRL
jgi:DNA invertase Pin-like site-specific DNA recombinase